MTLIDHINRYVSSVDKFIDFYCAVLDYKVIDRGLKRDGNKYAILKGDSHELFISEKNDFLLDSDQNFRHIGYYIKNVEERLEELKLKGLVEKDKEIIVKKYSKQFYLKDPDGFELDFIQWIDKEGFYRHLKEKYND